MYLEVFIGLLNKKKIMKIGPYAEDLYGDKHKRKYIRVESITSSILKWAKKERKVEREHCPLLKNLLKYGDKFYQYFRMPKCKFFELPK